MNDEVLIIGYGNVGKNLERALRPLHPDIYDKYKDVDTRTCGHHRFAFICVDAPKTENNLCDFAEIYDAIDKNPADFYILKSTILPERAWQIPKETGKRIVFSPEYYGTTQHAMKYNFNFTILGGEKEDCIEVQQLLQKVYDGRHHFRITDAKTAMLAKYMENCWLATKVTFCSQFFDISEQLGVNYEELRELFVLDPRVNPSHTYIYRDHPYWDSYCLSKDVNAIRYQFGAQFLKHVVEFNEAMKNRKENNYDV